VQEHLSIRIQEHLEHILWLAAVVALEVVDLQAAPAETVVQESNCPGLYLHGDGVKIMTPVYQVLLQVPLVPIDQLDQAVNCPGVMDGSVEEEVEEQNLEALLVAQLQVEELVQLRLTQVTKVLLAHFRIAAPKA
tara:strand:- start:119 stop:523 length:405 start_codon:yes stop_codon:yes gene_type:complete